MRKVSNLLGLILLVAGSTALAMADTTVAAPEINPASAGSALALVSGMVLMFRARRAK
jgi:FtsH-binding integral membrane protein